MEFVEPIKPLSSWKSDEDLFGSVIPCLTVIFRTGGCSWNRCRMCGYRHERYFHTDEEDLTRHILAQIAWVKNSYPDSDYQMLKIFTSGSFFDSNEMPIRARKAVAKAFKGKLIIAETRPEYVDAGAISEFLSIIDDGTWDRPLYIAMGLETTNDYIREKCIDKGHTFQDFINSAARARLGGAGVKTYLLMKPPFLTEKEAILDMNRSIEEAEPYSDILSMNVCTVQSGTDVEYYWKNSSYRPPYLWSVLSVLLDARPHVLCDPIGGGYVRGPHNCGTCDLAITRGIRDFSRTRDRELLRSLLEIDCRCKKEWEFVLENEMPYCMPLTR